MLPTFVLLFLFISSAQAQAPDPQASLSQAVVELQKSPADTALRERIIKLAAEMNPAPAIPEEARRHYVKARTLFDEAKAPAEAADAAAEFQQATLIAPWWGEAYMRMGLALETADRFDEATAALKWSMATNPGEEILRKTQDEIYKIEARKDKAAKDAQLAVQKAAQEQADQQAVERRRQEQVAQETRAREAGDTRTRAEAEARARLESVEGTWCEVARGKVYTDFWMRIRRYGNGDWGVEWQGNRFYASGILQMGRDISFKRTVRDSDPTLNSLIYSLSLSADGTTLSGSSYNPDTKRVDEREFRRQ